MINKIVNKKYANIDYKNENQHIDCRLWCAISIILLLCWMPYFLVYYPGFIFGDSLSSIRQALGVERLNNHHPILYTLALRVFLIIGIRIKDITFGCALFTLFQMIYVASCLGYSLAWVKKFKIFNSAIFMFLIAMFGLAPFFGQVSIAMWKDPIFSATLLVLSLEIYDLVFLDSGKHLNCKRKLLIYGLLAFLLCFSRNNGVYILLFYLLLLFIFIVLFFDK